MFDDDIYNNIINNIKELAKADLSLEDAFGIINHPDSSIEDRKKAGKVFERHIYFDTLIPKVGNLKAYKDFLSRNKDTGVHLSMDANSFGAINKEHGFDAGNAAISQMFNGISDISRKHGLKFFRVGGDEGRLHAPTQEKANAFIKDMKAHLDGAPTVRFQNEAGQEVDTKHKVSVSVGVGYSPEHAEKALIHAKNNLGPLGSDGHRIKHNLPGQEKTVVHSLLHEPPPPHWRPSTATAKPMPVESAAPAPGLKYSNPLKTPKADG